MHQRRGEGPQRDLRAVSQAQPGLSEPIGTLSSGRRVHALSRSSVLALQRSIGNAAVARLLRQEAEAAQAAPETGPEAGREEGEEEGLEGVFSGVVEELVGKEISTRGCDSHDHGPRPPQQPAREGVGSRGGLAVRAHLVFDGHAHRDGSLDGAKADAVAGTLTVGSQVTKGGASPGGNEFGVEKVKYKVDNTTWTVDLAKKIVDVNSRIFLDIGWGVHSLGNTNISGENDAAVKKETYADIVSDLTPSGSGRPKRDKYWCQDLTEKHEQFHASDDIQRAQLYTPTAQAWLSAQTVTPPTKKTGFLSGIRNAIDDWLFGRKIKKLLETARGNVEADGWAWYGAGGENRAYADGKASYQARVDAVSQRAKNEKW